MHAVSFSRLTIRRRLPLLIAALLLSILLVFGIISYLGIRTAELQAGEQRLQNSSLQLSNMLSNSTDNMVATAHGQASNPSVKAWLVSQGRDSATEVKMLFEKWKQDTNYLGAALLDSSYHPLLATSSPVSSALPFEPFRQFQLNKKNIGQVGKFFLLGDTVCYPIIAVISKNDNTIGYLVKWRRIQTKSGSVDQVKQLIGLGARFYVGNNDGSLWTDMTSRTPSRPYLKADNNIRHYKIAGETTLVSVRTISDSRWLVSVEFTQGKLLQTAGNYLYFLLVAGSFLLAAGIFCGWLMSKRISAPLARLTAAASRIAAGEESGVPVAMHRYDEIGKLARSFNAMAVQVETSKEELRREAANYKLLFEQNPMPMWIVSTNHYHILDVNEAALVHYGYSRDEFLQLDSRQMRPAEDVDLFLKRIQANVEDGEHRGSCRHKKKDGTIIMVDIIANNILYKCQPARLVLANDITEKLKAEKELIHHRVVQQQVITETTILVQEKEREEIGRELHDNINQILASAKLYLDIAKNGDEVHAASALSKSYDNIILVMGEIRKLSKQLVRPEFDTSLEESLKDMTGELQAVALFEIEFCCAQFNEQLVDESIKLMIYRIVQEQLNNILKYAEASHVKIQLKTDKENVYLLIKDDGVGFDSNEKSKGIGLRNINHRVRFHQGTVSIRSKPGAGCRLEIMAPFKKESFPVSEI
jgi:PAS domain S-box-containing protein